jgi:hypothetical protein
VTRCPRETAWDDEGQPIAWCGGRLQRELQVDDLGQVWWFICCKRCGER